MSNPKDTLQAAIDEAVMEAKATYKDADKSPIDHGYAMVKGIDGRTTLAKRLQADDRVRVTTDGYHGTTLTIEGVNRYLVPQRGAYDVFIKTLQAHEVSGAGDLRVWARAD